MENTTILDKLILFSELNFIPYALVVDLVRDCAASIMIRDEGHYGEIDMQEFQFMMDTVADRAKRKMHKRYERAAFGINRKPSEHDLSYAEYYQWLDLAVRAGDNYLAGMISKEDALKIIEQQ